MNMTLVNLGLIGLRLNFFNLLGIFECNYDLGSCPITAFYICNRHNHCIEINVVARAMALKAF